jgi:hypothetical protein
MYLSKKTISVTSRNIKDSVAHSELSQFLIRILLVNHRFQSGGRLNLL